MRADAWFVGIVGFLSADDLHNVDNCIKQIKSFTEK